MALISWKTKGEDHESKLIKYSSKHFTVKKNNNEDKQDGVQL